MNMKYIVFKQRKNDPEIVLIFSSNIVHSSAARRMGAYEVVGAGFFVLTSTGPYCYGMSESLGIQSRSEDVALIKRELGLE